MASHLGPEFDSSDESSLSGSGSGTQTPIAARPGARFDFTPPAPRAFHGHHVPDGDHQQQPEGLLTTADPDAANPQRCSARTLTLFNIRMSLYLFFFFFALFIFILIIFVCKACRDDSP
jgi:hypothetical protein